MVQAGTRYLADTSAWFWAAAVKEKWLRLLGGGQIATCPVVELEYLYAAPSSAEYHLWRLSHDLLDCIPLSEEVGLRATEVQTILADKEQMGHRSVRLGDLLIAACAEEAGLTVLHYDSDFDRIGEVTGQPCEWLAPRGSLKR